MRFLFHRFHFRLPALLLILIFCTTPFAADTEDVLVFAATGDGPRGEEDWDLLPRYFELERDDGRSEFLLHLGDICKGSLDPPEPYYVRVAELFKTSPVPVIFVPGDNEWNDHEDPQAAWTFWTRHFLRFHRNFEGAPTVTEQPVRPENLAWVSKSVLMIGINLVGGKVLDKDEWRLRHEQNAAWVRENMERSKGDVRAAIVFAQAKPTNKKETFFEPFEKSARSFAKPVMYLHGDGHKWEHEPGWRAANILRVQVDQVTNAPPVQITVSYDPEAPFKFDRRLGN